MKNKRIVLYCVTVFRWLVRIYGTLLLALVLAIFIGEGPPNPLKQPPGVQLELFGMFAMCVGLVLGWKWQNIGAILILGGIMMYHIVEKRLLLMGAFPLFDLAGILYLLSWLLTKLQKSDKHVVQSPLLRD